MQHDKNIKFSPLGGSKGMGYLKGKLQSRLTFVGLTIQDVTGLFTIVSELCSDYRNNQSSLLKYLIKRITSAKVNDLNIRNPYGVWEYVYTFHIGIYILSDLLKDIFSEYDYSMDKNRIPLLKDHSEQVLTIINLAHVSGAQLNIN